MGIESSSFSNTSTRSIIGEDDSQKLTAEEIKLVEDQSDVFNCFFRHPSLENYQAIRSNDVLYQKALGNKYKLYLWALCDTFTELDNPIDENDALDYQLEVDRLLDPRNALNASDLDSLWTLYYATGDQQFPNRVKSILNNELQHEIVRGAARWSYDSHIQQGMLEDPDWKHSGVMMDAFRFATGASRPELDIPELKWLTREITLLKKN